MDDLIKSIYAGFMIGLGGTIYLAMENRVIGAILFSFGLLTIVNQGFYLYTGKVGYEGENIPLMTNTICGNAIGTFIAAFLMKISEPQLIDKVNSIWNNKLSQPKIVTFILAILCGIMMYLAVDNYKKNNKLLFLMLPVIIFILAGFEHSIANLFYMFLSGSINGDSLWYIIICIIGNGFGSRVFHLFKTYQFERVGAK